MRLFSLILTLLATCVYASARTFVLDAHADGTQPDVFTDAKSALANLPDGSEADPTVLIVHPGVYWLDDPDDPAIRRPAPGDGSVPYAASLSAHHVVIRALSSDPSETVFAVNRGQTHGADGNFTMLRVTSSDLTVEGITFGNYCNVDLIYARDPIQNRPRRADAIVQAQIAICHGSDRLHFRNCRFISRLNLCPFVGARRTLFENCHFECTDDALSGSAIYSHCDFDFFSSKPFYSTSQTGAIFLSCQIRSRVRGLQCLTKTGGPLTMIDTEISAPEVTNVVWSRGDEDYVCYVHSLTLNGQPCIPDSTKPWRTVDLNGSPALATYVNPDGSYNIGGLLAGNDNWNPTSDSHPRPLPTTHVIHVDENTLSHDVLLWGGWPSNVTIPSESLSADASGWRSRTDRLVRQSPDGLQATALHFVAGVPHAAPACTRPLRVMQMRDGSLRVTYSISAPEGEDAEGQADVSLVRWSRRAADGTLLPLKQSRQSGKLRYTPTAADAGHTITIEVIPQCASTLPGEPLWAEVPCPSEHKPWQSTETTFADIPLHFSMADSIKGIWLSDAHKPQDTQPYQWEAHSSASAPAWVYDSGVDGAADSQGLVTARRGARLLFNAPAEPCKSMSFELDIDPCKPAGQGFGSATGQYLEIALAYDFSTGTGLALRIERVPDYDKAVSVRLVRHTNFSAQPLTESMRCDLFRPGFSVSLHVDNNRFSAILKNDQSTQTLSTDIPSQLWHPSVLVQHTGTLGGGGLVIKRAKVCIDEK